MSHLAAGFAPILAIDTAHATTGLMLAHAESRAHRVFPAKQTTELFLPTLQTLLDECGMRLADLHTIVWNAGPGSFTSLRLASALIQGLTYHRPINVVALHAFAALLLHVETKYPSPPAHVLAAHDARADEVYWACYRWQGKAYVADNAIEVSAPAVVLETMQSAKAMIGIGNGFDAFPPLTEALTAGADIIAPTESLTPTLLQNMIAMVETSRTAEFCLPAETACLPHYVRNRVAKPLAEQQAWQTRFLNRRA